MNKHETIICSAILGLIFIIGGAPFLCAQETDIGEFTLEEITVTAEKREVNVQQIPASVQALVGNNLIEQGKITAAQILEDIPNVKYQGGGEASAPNSTIAIRGVQYKKTSDGQPPAATATYVDGVFQGYGSTLDIERVEVLRGPQGTLYGRSATGGVVAFHTKDPIIDEFSADASAEFGEANLRNFQAVVNVPVLDFLAVRAAGRFLERDGYYNPDGGYSATKEGRIKTLFKPSDAFDIMLNVTINEQKSNSGGYAARLTSPTTIDYEDTLSDLVEGIWRRGYQGSLAFNYDFGESILTYIGSMRTYKNDDSPGSIVIRPGAQIMNNTFYNFGEEFRSHEIRLASDSEGPLTWLVGGSYYYGDYDRSQYSIQVLDYYADGTEVTIPESINAPIFKQDTNGSYENYGIFTEETYELRDDLRVTAGLRYDKTDVVGYSSFDFNLNVEPVSEASLNPPDWRIFSLTDTPEFNNVTYKLRFEHDVTPDNMLYILTATGFQPGDVRLTNEVAPGPEGMEVTFFALPYDEEKLTSYEVGSKNRLLDDRMQLNVSAFYYDYEGYRHTINTALAGPPVFAVIATPLRMIGAELASDYLVTPVDKVSFSLGALDAKITGYPDLPELSRPVQEYMELERLPGLPQLTANLGYDHTFSFTDGSILTPRADLHYTSSMYVVNLTTDQLNTGLAPYAHQDSYIIANIGATWTSSTDRFSLMAYVRNLFDTEYKTDADVESGVNAVGVTAGDPRTLGVVFRARF